MFRNFWGKFWTFIKENDGLSPNEVKIKFKRLRDSAVLPFHAHTGDLGFDIYVVTDSHFLYDKKEKKWCLDLLPMSPRLFDVGFAAEIPSGYGILLKDRSGLSSKGISVLGGVVDSGYRGPFRVCICNLTRNVYRIYDGDRICQAVVIPQYNTVWEEVNELSDSDRGISGYGSSGN